MRAVSKQERVEAEQATERPTIVPPFDPEEFARESESGLHAAAAPTSPPPTPRVLARPEAPFLELTPSRSTRSPSSPDAPEIEEPPVDVDLDGSDALNALGLHAVPVLGVSRDELEWVVLSADADRLLTFIDGARTLEAVAAMAKTSAEEVAAVLLDLADQGLVSFVG
jgi:hypothetical protein